MTEFARIETEMGVFGLLSNHKKITRLLLPNNKSIRTTQQTPNIDRSHFFKDALLQINQYFNKQRDSFNVEIDLRLPKFYNKILYQVSKIKYGETISYKELATKVGHPRSARAAGSANAKNPIPLLIPCHRVIMSNGRIGDYAGGHNLKKMLLNHEGVL